MPRHNGRNPRHARNGAATHQATQLRQHICLEAARILAEEGVRDYRLAKRKACERLNVTENRLLPANEEIEAALRERLQTFHARQLARDLEQRYALAREAMDFLAGFEPRLVGAVVNGAVTPHTPVELHVFADAPEDVGLFLTERGIPYENTDKRVRFGGDRSEQRPGCRFDADGVAIEITVFPVNGLREAPLSPVDGRPMRRVALKELPTPAG